MGKWAQGEYERTCADKIKTLFYRAHQTNEYSVDIERNFRAFVKSLDVDDRLIKSTFRSIVRRQHDLDLKATPKKDEGTTRARWQHRAYPNHDESNIRANDDHINGAGPSRQRTRYLPPGSLTDSEEEEVELPALGMSHGGWSAREVNEVWHPGEELDEWDDFGDAFGGGFEGYQDVPLNLGADSVINETETTPERIARGGRIQGSRSRPIPIRGSESPPWSLSHERRRARNSDINASRPGPQAAEPTYDSLPLFLPVGDTPLPASDDTGPHTLLLNPASPSAPVPAPRSPQYFTLNPLDTPPAMDRPDWLQLARTEIDEETASNRSDIPPREVSPSVIIDPSNPRTGQRAPMDPLVPATRRGRIHLEDTGVPDETDRIVRRRTTSGPLDSFTRPPFLPPPRPSVPFPPSTLGGARMQRTRHSMPPSSVIAGRDTRRDGVVFDLQEFDDHISPYFY